MRTLIMSCNTGAGHNSCAKAIQEVYQERGELCDIVDALQFISPHASRFISNWHTRIYRYAPKLFKAGYADVEQHESIFREGTTVYKYLTSGVDRMREYLESGSYDNIICTHVFPALAVTELLRRYPLRLQTSFVSTDYTCSPCAADSNLDFYFIPSPLLTEEFAGCGVAREKLVPSGLPAAQAFYHPMEKAEAKRALGIAPEKQHLLMMCGSMGCGPICELAELLEPMLREDQLLSIICGTNSDLFAPFSMPRHAEHARGYVAYSTTEARDGYILSSGVYYTHQQSWLQYPVVTAMEKRLTTTWGDSGAFRTVQDALQFFPEDGQLLR